MAEHFCWSNTLAILLKQEKQNQITVLISVRVRLIQRWEVCDKSKIWVKVRTFRRTIVYIYIYIYIYIVIHRQTIFVISQLFSVARHLGCFKLGSKPSQLYVKLSILPLSQQATYISSEIITPYVLTFISLCFYLWDTRMLNSFEELCITWMAAINSFARVLNSQTDCFVVSQLFSVARHVWCFKLGSPPNFTLDLVSYCSAHRRHTLTQKL